MRVAGSLAVTRALGDAYLKLDEFAPPSFKVCCMLCFVKAPAQPMPSPSHVFNREAFRTSVRFLKFLRGTWRYGSRL